MNMSNVVVQDRDKPAPRQVFYLRRKYPRPLDPGDAEALMQGTLGSMAKGQHGDEPTRAPVH
jgi:hypothetical protein